MRYFIVDVDGIGGKAEGDIIIGHVENGFVIENNTNTAFDLNDLTPLIIRD